MKDLNRELLDFIDASPTAWHAVHCVCFFLYLLLHLQTSERYFVPECHTFEP